MSDANPYLVDEEEASGNPYLSTGLLERAANAAAQIIAGVAPARLLNPVEANEIFIRLSAAEAKALRDQGFDFYDWGEGAARLVTSWHHREADVAPLAKAIAAL